MNPDFSIAYSLISLWIIFYIWFTLVARLRRDRFRCNIRKIRDDLFDFMWKNNVDFNTAAYKEVRQFLNGMLRGADVLTPTSLIAHAIGAIRYGALGENRKETDFVKAMKTVSDPTLKQMLENAQAKAMVEMLSFVFLQGLIGFLVKGIFYFSTFFLRTKTAFHAGVNQMSDFVYQLGNPNLTNSGMGQMCRR